MGYNGDTENGKGNSAMFCGKEEHFPVSSLREVLADYFEMGYHDGEKIGRGNSAFCARSLARVMRL